jgi:hypothetical protein
VPILPGEKEGHDFISSFLSLLFAVHKYSSSSQLHKNADGCESSEEVKSFYHRINRAFNTAALSTAIEFLVL